MFPTRVFTGSSQGTQFSRTRRHSGPRCAATGATWRMWFDWYPPIETRVSAPPAGMSGTMHSSLPILFSPDANPLRTSSPSARTRAPPRCSLSLLSGLGGPWPKVSG